MINLQSSVNLQVAPITYSLIIGFGASEDVGGHYSTIQADINLNANVPEDLPSGIELDVDEAIASFVSTLSTILNTIEGDTINLNKRVLTADYVQLLPVPE